MDASGWLPSLEDFGPAWRDAVELAFAEVNAAGGAPGPVEIWEIQPSGEITPAALIEPHDYGG